jgi:stearoyl-CoA desaturase (delta-9 desaturase)
MTPATEFTKTLIPGGPGTHEAPARRPKSNAHTDPFRQPAPSRRPATKKQRSNQHGGSGRLINWPNVIWLTVVHLGCLAAPFFFSWEAVALTLALHWITGGIGICLGFHRHLTHTSFTTYRPVR